MNSKTFCMSPFVRMTQWWNGNLNTCTHYHEMSGDGSYHEKQIFIPKDKYNSLSDAFNGEEMQDLRFRMINGEYLDGCRYCYHLESSMYFWQPVQLENLETRRWDIRRGFTHSELRVSYRNGFGMWRVPR